MSDHLDTLDKVPLLVPGDFTATVLGLAEVSQRGHERKTFEEMVEDGQISFLPNSTSPANDKHGRPSPTCNWGVVYDDDLRVAQCGKPSTYCFKMGKIGQVGYHSACNDCTALARERLSQYMTWCVSYPRDYQPPE